MNFSFNQSSNHSIIREMDIEFLRDYALKKDSTTESTPFGNDTLVYKVYGKIFMLLSLDTPLQINLKCDPELAIELREKYESIIPGYHMNKTHWNTVIIDGTVPAREILKLIDHSYSLVLNSIPVKRRK